MDGTTWGYVISALITGFFGVFIVWQNYRLGRNTKTNHGKTLGQHAEDASAAAELAAAKADSAKAAVDLVAMQLETYKHAQAMEALDLQRVIEGYVATDALAHAELRELITSTAITTQQNTTNAAASIRESQAKPA